MGDVKLAGVLGLYLGFLGWGQLLVGAFAAFVLGGLFASSCSSPARRAQERDPVRALDAAGRLGGIFAGQAIAGGYLSIVGLL